MSLLQPSFTSTSCAHPHHRVIFCVPGCLSLDSLKVSLCNLSRGKGLGDCFEFSVLPGFELCFLKKLGSRAGEMVHWFRALVALPEDLVRFPVLT